MFAMEIKANVITPTARPQAKSNDTPRSGFFRRLAKARTGPYAWVVYASARSLFAFMQMFPLDWNLKSARLFAKVWPMIMPRHRERAIEHLTASLGDELTPTQIQDLADRSLENVTMFAIEAICLPRRLSPLTWSRYFQIVDFDDAINAFMQGRGGIIVTPHYGPFEISAHVMAALGFDIIAVMRPLDNEYMNRYLVDSRKTQGLKLIDKKGATTQAQSLLEDNYMVTFVGDQDAGRKGIFVDFFGQPASTYKSIGLLAMVTKRPIIVGYTRRLGNQAKYVLGVERVIHPQEWADKDDPLRWITQEYTSAFERVIRKDPAQYLWIHRRWKSKPRVPNRPEPQVSTVR